MPKQSAATPIPVVQALSLRQLAAFTRNFSPALKRGTVNLEAHRRALQRTKPPVSYTISQRVSLLSKSGIQFKPPTGEVGLSVRRPWIDGVGRLYFFNVVDYITHQDRANLFMTKLGGGSFFSVTVHADSPGAHYLLDISVSGVPGLTLTRIGGGMSATADSAGHVLLVLSAGSQSEAGISLIVEGESMYNFHNVVVSKI